MSELPPWQIAYSKTAEKGLTRLDRTDQARIRAAIDRLPEAGDVKRLQGKTGAAQYRLRVGDWRVRFAIDHGLRTIDIADVASRGGAYSRSPARRWPAIRSTKDDPPPERLLVLEQTRATPEMLSLRELRPQRRDRQAS